MNPQPTQLYSLMKLLKEEYSVRPVTVPATEISKILSDIVNSSFNFKAKFVIKKFYILLLIKNDINPVLKSEILCA